MAKEGVNPYINTGYETDIIHTDNEENAQEMHETPVQTTQELQDIPIQSSQEIPEGMEIDPEAEP